MSGQRVASSCSTSSACCCDAGARLFTEPTEDAMSSSICCGGTSIPQRLLSAFLWHRVWKHRVQFSATAWTRASALQALCGVIDGMVRARLADAPAAAVPGETLDTRQKDRGWVLVAWESMPVGAEVAPRGGTSCGAASASAAEKLNAHLTLLTRSHFVRMLEVALPQPTPPAAVFTAGTCSAGDAGSNGATAAPRWALGPRLARPSAAAAATPALARQLCKPLCVTQQEVVVRLLPVREGSGVALEAEVAVSLWMEPQEGVGLLRVRDGTTAVDGAAGPDRELAATPVSSRGLYAALCHSVMVGDIAALRGAGSTVSSAASAPGIAVSTTVGDAMNHVAFSSKALASGPTKDVIGMVVGNHARGAPVPPNVPVSHCTALPISVPQPRFTADDASNGDFRLAVARVAVA